MAIPGRARPRLRHRGGGRKAGRLACVDGDGREERREGRDVAEGHLNSRGWFGRGLWGFLVSWALLEECADHGYRCS